MVICLIGRIFSLLSVQASGANWAAWGRQELPYALDVGLQVAVGRFCSHFFASAALLGANFVIRD